MNIDRLDEKGTKLLQKALEELINYRSLQARLKDIEADIARKTAEAAEAELEKKPVLIAMHDGEWDALKYAVNIRLRLIELEKARAKLTIQRDASKRIIDEAQQLLDKVAEENDAAVKGAQQIARFMHPGEMLAEKVKEMGWGADTAAINCGMSTGYYNDFIAGRCGVDGQARARSLEQGTKIPAHLWLELQRRWDDEHPQKA